MRYAFRVVMSKLTQHSPYIYLADANLYIQPLPKDSKRLIPIISRGSIDALGKDALDHYNKLIDDVIIDSLLDAPPKIKLLTSSEIRTKLLAKKPCHTQPHVAIRQS